MNLDRVKTVWDSLETQFAKSGEQDRLAFLQTLLGYSDGKYGDDVLIAFAGEGVTQDRLAEYNEVRDNIRRAAKNCKIAAQRGIVIENLDTFIRTELEESGAESDTFDLEDYQVYKPEWISAGNAVRQGFLSDNVILREDEIVRHYVMDVKYLCVKTVSDVFQFLKGTKIESNKFYQVVYGLLVGLASKKSMQLPIIFVTSELYRSMEASDKFKISEKVNRVQDSEMVTKTLNGESYVNRGSVFSCTIEDAFCKHCVFVVEVEE